MGINNSRCNVANKKIEMTEEMNNEYMEMLRKNIPQLDMALHINKSNLGHIEFLENKIIELEKNLIDEYQYINNLTNITDKYCIREYTDQMIKELKEKK
jgi:hypothetical protein